MGIETSLMITINQKDDSTQGCQYSHVNIDSLSPNIKVCLVNINELQLIAVKISSIILNNSWVRAIDPTVRRAYERTVDDTANKLNEICQKIITNPQIEEDFGEIMVSITASESLKQIFDHIPLPISELWKEKLSGNPGFDFHTICPTNFIHFGEAKYSSSNNPYTDAIKQAKRFIDDEKHMRDIPHLRHIVPSEEPINNLNQNQFSIVAAFSINTTNIEIIIEKAVQSVVNSSLNNIAQNIYLIGVIIC